MYVLKDEQDGWRGKLGTPGAETLTPSELFPLGGHNI